jgi:hypothetical protein
MHSSKGRTSSRGFLLNNAIGKRCISLRKSNVHTTLPEKKGQRFYFIDL